MSSKLEVLSDIISPPVQIHVCPFRVSSKSSVVDDAEEFVASEEPGVLLESVERENELPPVSEWYRLWSHVYGTIRFRTVEDLLKSVEENPQQNVELDFNRCGYTSLQVQIALHALMQTRLECLTVLDLCRNRLLNLSTARLLGNVLQELQTIAYLSLSYNILDDESIGVLSDALSNSGVRRFQATHCHITDRGGSLMFSALAYSDCIEEINVSWNHLENASGVAIGRFLTTQKTLKELILSGNHLYHEVHCIVPLLLGVIGNETLEHLDLSWNSLRGEEFGRAFLKAIPQAKLKRLNLEHNMLSTVDMSFVVRMMKKSDTLEELWLGSNVLEEDVTVDLVRSFGRHPTLRFLSLGSFQFVSQRVAKLSQFFMRKNRTKTIIYQGPLMANPPRPVDLQEMLLERCRFLAQKPKKAKLKRDLGHLMLQLAAAENTVLSREDFVLAVKRFRVKLDQPLMEALMDAFEVPKKCVDTAAMAAKYLTKHPTEPPVVKAVKGKGRKK